MLFAFFLKGFAVGVVIAVPVGPVGILCIRRTLFEGKLPGFVSGLGAATADAVFGAIAAFGLTFISDLLLGYQDWLRFGGAGFLLYVGISALLSGPRVGPPPRNGETLFADYVSTFGLTLTNPITILVFLGIFAAVGLTDAETTLARAAFLVLGVWSGSLLWWLVVIFGAGLFFRSLEPRHLSWLNRGSAGILVLCGIALLGTLLAAHLP